MDMKLRSPTCVLSVCFRSSWSVCLQGHGRENRLLCSKLPRPWTVVRMEKWHPDGCDFGYCFHYHSWVERRGVTKVFWRCVCLVQVLRHSSLPSPWVLLSLFSMCIISRFHLFAVLVSGKFYIRQSNFHRHNQRDVRVTAYSWLLLAWEEKAKFMVNIELFFWCWLFEYNCL